MILIPPRNPVANGYYNLPNPDGKPCRYVRATTIAKTLDNTYNLEKWGKRQVAKGVARTPSLAAAVNADHDNNQALDRACEQAIIAAGGTEARDLGTALHRLIERHDTGGLDHPGVWADHIGAYQRALTAHQLTVDPRWCETVLVNHPLGIAGRVDRLLIDPDGELVVADLKTGGFTAWLAWATQFAIYATSTHWWNDQTDRLEPLPRIRQDHSLAIHLPAAVSPPTCEIVGLSVPAGMDALALALEVRRLRATDRRKDIAADTYQPPCVVQHAADLIVAAFPPPATRDGLTRRIAIIRDDYPVALRQLGARWPDIPTLKQSDNHTPEQLGRIDLILRQVETEHSIPF